MLGKLIYCGVYKIVYTPTKDFYIGSSFNIAHRFEQHMMSRGKWFDSAREDYTLELVEECESRNLKAREQYWIDKLKPTLNKNPISNKPPIYTGEDNNKAIGTKSQYVEAFKLLAQGKTCKVVANEVGLTLGVVKNILALNTHKYKEEYEIIKSMKKPKVFCLYHPEHGEVCWEGSYKDFCIKYSLPINGHLGCVVTGRRKSFHGWTKVEVL